LLDAIDDGVHRLQRLPDRRTRDASRGAFVFPGSLPSIVSVHAFTIFDTLRP
jgi:hypothetical protein